VEPAAAKAGEGEGRCRCCGGVTVAPVPEGMEQGSPFSLNIIALAIYLRATHAISYQRLSRVFLNLFALNISEGALNAIPRVKPEGKVPARQALLRRPGRGDPRPAAPLSPDLLGRDHGAHQQRPALELGVPERAGGHS